jgi:hypothetical protein
LFIEFIFIEFIINNYMEGMPFSRRVDYISPMITRISRI